MYSCGLSEPGRNRTQDISKTDLQACLDQVTIVSGASLPRELDVKFQPLAANASQQNYIFGNVQSVNAVNLYVSLLGRQLLHNALLRYATGSHVS